MLVMKGQYIEQAIIITLRENILLWEGVLVLIENSKGNFCQGTPVEENKNA